MGLQHTFLKLCKLRLRNEVSEIVQSSEKLEQIQNILLA